MANGLYNEKAFKIKKDDTKIICYFKTLFEKFELE